jgi:uncharacterized protein YegP (UPF0339 family)
MSKYVISQKDNGKYQFVLVAPNGSIIVTSKEYETLIGLFNGIASTQKNSQTETIVKDYENKSTK